MNVDIPVIVKQNLNISGARPDQHFGAHSPMAAPQVAPAVNLSINSLWL